MEKYHMLLDKAHGQGIKIKENCYFESDAAAILCKNVIGLSDRLDTTIEHKCILAKELGATENFIKEAIEILKRTFGEKKGAEDYTLYFEPYLHFRKK